MFLCVTNLHITEILNDNNNIYIKYIDKNEK